MDWSMLEIWAIWVMGWVKFFTYWMKDWISPTWMVPWTARTLPRTATDT